ncbi:Protein ALP1-like [Formica fusca]
MSVEQFDMLHNLLKPKLEKKSHRNPLEIELHLALTLSYLAHGDSAATTAGHLRVEKSTVYSIIPEVCKAIWDVLQPLYLRCPNEENEWLQIANEFNSLWNFPNCIGAIDGKHIRIKAPPKSGSASYNYKGSFSFMLMAICDARYRFTWLDIGSLNDASIWSNTEMSTTLENNTVSLPPELYLQYTNVAVPFALVGDEGFPLKKYLMRPYARKNLIDNQQRIFNYRLSRARRIIENSFGILVARWQIFQGSICFKLETAEAIVYATCCLHNFIISTNYSSNRYIQEDFVDREGPNGELIEGEWRNMIQHPAINRMGRVGANIGLIAAMRQRDTLAQYFVSDEGSIP